MRKLDFEGFTELGALAAESVLSLSAAAADEEEKEEEDEELVEGDDAKSQNSKVQVKVCT